MARLDELASVVRSKNAGPRKVTFDIMFDKAENYERVRGALPHLRAEASRRLGVSDNKLTVIDYPAAKAIKIVMSRVIMAGRRGDRDAYGAQQHAPLLGLDI